MPKTVTKRLSRRSTQPEGGSLPAIQPQGGSFGAQFQQVDSPAQTLMSSLNAFLEGRQKLGKIEEESGIQARFKKEFTGEDIVRDEQTSFFLRGYDRLDGSLAGNSLVNTYNDLYSNHGSLPWQDTLDDQGNVTQQGFSSLLAEAEQAATAELDTKSKLQGFMEVALPARKKIEGLYNENHLKVERQKLVDKETALLDIEARNVMADTASTILGRPVSVEDIKKDPDVYAELMDNEEFQSVLSAKMRGVLTNHQNLAEVLGFSKKEISGMAADVWGKLGVDTVMPEVLDYIDLPDASGVRVSTTDAGTMAIAKRKEALNLRDAKLAAGAKQKAAAKKNFAGTVINQVRAVVEEFDYTNIPEAEALMKNLQSGGILYEGTIIPFSELMAGDNGAYKSLLQDVKDIAEGRGFPKESNPAVQRELFVNARRGKLSWHTLSANKRNLNGEDYKQLAGILSSEEQEKSPAQKRSKEIFDKAYRRITSSLVEVDQFGEISGIVESSVRKQVNDALWEFDNWYGEEIGANRVPDEKEIMTIQRSLIDFYGKVIEKAKELPNRYLDVTPWYDPRGGDQAVPDVDQLYDMLTSPERVQAPDPLAGIPSIIR